MIGLGFFIGSEGGGFGHDLRWLRMGGGFFYGLDVDFMLYFL